MIADLRCGWPHLKWKGVEVEASDVGFVFTAAQEVMVIREFLEHKYNEEFTDFEKIMLIQIRGE